MKKSPELWRRRDGKVIKISDMEDFHLANCIKLVGRLWKEKVEDTNDFKILSHEARNRRFQIFVNKTPKMINGREEYIDVCIPSPSFRLSSSIIVSELDSRCKEDV